MAKSTKIKKTDAEKQADLRALIGGGGVTTLSDLAQGIGQDASASDEEQKGEKAPATPSAVPSAPVEQLPPASDSPAGGVADLEQPAALPAANIEATPLPVADKLSTPTEPLADAPTAAPAAVAQLAAADVSENLPLDEQPIAPVSTPTDAPAPEPTPDEPTQDEPAQELASGPTAAPHPARLLELASLFKSNPPGRKGITSRLSEGHYQYLQMLGTVLGNRTTVPEIVSNIIDLFIAEHDDTIQKALTKKLRAARTAPKNS